MQNKFEKTATLMRHHHHRSHGDYYRRQNLALLLDPFNNSGNSVSSASNPNYFDQHTFGLHEGILDSDEPIFVPHREKVSRILFKAPFFIHVIFQMELPSQGARQRCCINLSVWIDRMCRILFPLAYFVFVVCYFTIYSTK